MQADAAVLQQVPITSVAVTRDPDATPFVRRLTKALTLNAFSTTGQDALSRFTGTIGISSSTDSQCATISRSEDEIEVCHGTPGPGTPVVLVDKFTLRPPVDAPSSAEVEEVIRLINPALPPWQELLPSFWSAVENLAGLPPILLSTLKQENPNALAAAAPPTKSMGHPKRCNDSSLGWSSFPTPSMEESCSSAAASAAFRQSPAVQ